VEPAALIYGTVQRWTTVVAIRMSSHLGGTIDANPRHRPAGRRRRKILLVGERQSTPRVRAGLSRRVSTLLRGRALALVVVAIVILRRNRRSNIDAQKTTRVSRRQLVERVGRTRCECSSARTAIRLGAGQAGRTGDTGRHAARSVPNNRRRASERAHPRIASPSDDTRCLRNGSSIT